MQTYFIQNTLEKCFFFVFVSQNYSNSKGVNKKYDASETGMASPFKTLSVDGHELGTVWVWVLSGEMQLFQKKEVTQTDVQDSFVSETSCCGKTVQKL